MIKMLRESDDKITARTYDQLISKLEKRGYDCKDCYEGDDYLYLRKDGDSYEAEYYKKDNGTYELYLGNIHPAKKTEGCCGKCHKKESISRKYRKGLREEQEKFNPQEPVPFYEDIVSDLQYYADQYRYILSDVQTLCDDLGDKNFKLYHDSMIYACQKMGIAWDNTPHDRLENVTESLYKSLKEVEKVISFYKQFAKYQIEYLDNYNG